MTGEEGRSAGVGATLGALLILAGYTAWFLALAGRLSAGTATPGGLLDGLLWPGILAFAAAAAGTALVLRSVLLRRHPDQPRIADVYTAMLIGPAAGLHLVFGLLGAVLLLFALRR